MKQYNEQTSGQVAVTFRDSSGTLATPTSVSYRIDCLTTGASVRASAALTPASSITIGLTPSDTTIVGANNAYEIKSITVTSAYAGSEGATQEMQYSVVNLRNV